MSFQYPNWSSFYKCWTSETRKYDVGRHNGGSLDLELSGFHHQNLNLKNLGKKCALRFSSMHGVALSMSPPFNFRAVTLGCVLCFSFPVPLHLWTVCVVFWMRNVPASSYVCVVGHQLIILFGRKNLAEGMVDWAGLLGSKAWPHFLFTLCPLTEEAMWVQPPVPATKHSPPPGSVCQNKFFSNLLCWLF